MSDRIFIDTKIIIYSCSSSERQKQLIAQKRITESNSYIRTQVLTEQVKAGDNFFVTPTATQIQTSHS